MKRSIRICVMGLFILLLFGPNPAEVTLPEPETALLPPPVVLPEPPRGPVRFTLVVTGDLMVHTDQLNDAWERGQGYHDFSHSFEAVTSDLAEGFAIGNLETVFGGEEIGYSDYPRFNTPDSFGTALKHAGFDFLTTANNHSMDKDEAGLLRTLEVLEQLEIDHTGTFSSQQERDAICIREVEGVRIAFLAYTFSTNGIPVPEGKDYLVNMIEEDLISKDLARARALHPDLIVVLPHNGNEYEYAPRDPFVVWTDFMIQNGADVVLSSHPHVLQRMEVKEIKEEEGVRNAFVIYSLGNFISSQRFQHTETTMILKLDFYQAEEGEPVILERVRFVPAWVQFNDSDNNRLVRVVPTYDAIQDLMAENQLGMRQSDLVQLRNAHNWVVSLYLGAAEDREMQREYVFYQWQEEDIS